MFRIAEWGSSEITRPLLRAIVDWHLANVGRSTGLRDCAQGSKIALAFLSCFAWRPIIFCIHTFKCAWLMSFRIFRVLFDKYLYLIHFSMWFRLRSQSVRVVSISECCVVIIQVISSRLEGRWEMRMTHSPSFDRPFCSRWAYIFEGSTVSSGTDRQRYLHYVTES